MKYAFSFILGGILMTMIQPQLGWSWGITACVLTGLLVGLISYQIEDISLS